MKTVELSTPNPNVYLIEPNIDRDAELSVGWLNGAAGRNTLSLMGVSIEENKSTDLETERDRIKDFIEKDNQLNWMIQVNGSVVGSIWADLEDTGWLPAPAIHIMIGDPKARGQGVGKASADSVINHLKELGYENLYSRTITSNSIASNLLLDEGFKVSGDRYVDSKGLEWQNYALDLSK